MSWIQERAQVSGRQSLVCTPFFRESIRSDQKLADENPSTRVLGINLSPIQLVLLPPNLEFQIDDLEEDWTFSYKFAYIHGRMLFSCFKDPARVIAQAVHALEPRGYLELQEALPTFVSDEKEKPLEGTCLIEQVKLLYKGVALAGKDQMYIERFKEYIVNAGLEDVKEVRYRQLIHPWPLDEYNKELGR